MRKKLVESEKYKEIGDVYLKYGSKMSSQTQQKRSGHVMISYQWGNQETAKDIYKYLCDKGLRVWIDVNDMRGSTIEGMAYAVENADAVLMCYSQKYKDSNNCRAEAENAFKKNKKIIPLRMQRDYKPDGWLDFILGCKLYYDFSGKYPFESKIKDVLKELCESPGNDEPDGIIVPQKATLYSNEKPPAATDTNEVMKWTPEQVAVWLTKHEISRERFSSLTGIEVAFLQVVVKKSPDQELFYKIITKTMKITDLLTMSKLHFALHDTAM